LHGQKFFATMSCKELYRAVSGVVFARGDMLDVFITSRVRRKIIVVYAKYPDFKTHVRGLAKLIKEDPGNIQRELKRLEKSGFLITEKQGNTRLYSTNKSFPIFKELQAIVIKSQQLSGNKNRSSTE